MPLRRVKPELAETRENAALEACRNGRQKIIADRALLMVRFERRLCRRSDFWGEVSEGGRSPPPSLLETEASVHATLTTRPVRLAQLELLELARRGAHESIPNLDRRRALVMRHPGPAVLDELL